VGSRGDHAVPVFLDHGEAAAGQVAQVVGELGGVDVVEALPGEVAIAVPGHVPEQVVAEGVGPWRWMASSRVAATPSDLDILPPPKLMKPWAQTVRGRGRPALMSMAGQ
jgi:hypothetical protein